MSPRRADTWRDRWRPTSLVLRYALATAGLAAAALLLTSLGSWWLIRQQHDSALLQLAQRESHFRAEAVGSDLRALAARMAEIAGSTILATGLVDSAGRETYLTPFLNGIRQINGMPVQLSFTDFRGVEIASNDGTAFTAEQLAWLRANLEDARPMAAIFSSPGGDELVAMAPMLYARTRSPEGAVLYKVALRDLNAGPSVVLAWGPKDQAPPDNDAPSAVVNVPPVYAPLHFRVTARPGALDFAASPELPYFHIVLITALLFIAIVVAGLNLARVLTSDLQRLEWFATGLTEGDLSAGRAPEGGSAEVSALARSINSMLDRLGEQHAALHVEQEKLTRLTLELQAADRRKDDFLAMLGHELRNPLAPISAGAQLLAKLPTTDPRIVRTSEVIARQVGQMTKIVNDLLDVSRVTRGLVSLEQATLDLGEVASAAIEQVRPLVQTRAHELTLSLPETPVHVIGDHARLVQVVSNLLTNAAKYTLNGGAIHITVEADHGDAVVRVRDNGVGISAELMPDIFDLFTQGSRSVDRGQGGLGLGLALVKNLVGLHGGQVTAHSGGPGHGAEFTVRLPRCTDHVPLAKPAADPPPTSPPRRVLVVDDNADAARTLADCLKLEGHTVYVAHDGPTAIHLAAGIRVDAFVLDIGLPGMDGRELARRLRALPDSADAMLIALSGYGQAADVERSAEAGFDHHLVKPADPRRLQALLARGPVARLP